MNLPLWIEFFDDLQNIRGRSQNTIMAYRRDLELYDSFLSQSKGDIAAFTEFMRKQKLSTRSQARVISSLRTYFKFCEHNGRKSPELRELHPPKIKAALPKTLTLEEFEKLMQACIVEDTYKSARNQTTLLLLFGLGCRVSELIGLDITDFHPTDGWLCVTGKGGKQRMIPLTLNLIESLKSYLHEVRPQLVKEKTHSILVNDRGHRPSRIDIWRWLAAWSIQAGFDGPISPHKFRHGCATALLESGADLRSIQVLLGHSSIQTTQIYTSVSTSQMKKAVDEFHPLSKIDKISDI